ncbi:MAG: hypothetical protein QXD98_00115 [Candidatus Diapherotrites archaeon]
MHLLKIKKKEFCLIACKTTTDSYDTTIKKLTLMQKKGFIQLIPQKFLKSKWHALIALDHVFSLNQKIAKSKSLEFLVRVLGTNQLSKALEKVEKEFFLAKDFVLVFDSKKFELKKILSNLNLEETNFKEVEDIIAIEKTALVALK